MSSCAKNWTAGVKYSRIAASSSTDLPAAFRLPSPSTKKRRLPRAIDHGAFMSKPKVLIFAPREEPPETVNALEGMGCEIVFGDRDWQLPRTTHEEAGVEAGRDALALMGTSIRHTRISRRIMQASQRLRVVAKYTVGVDDIDTEAATELGVMVCHAPTESNCFGVAEATVTFMLALFKKITVASATDRKSTRLNSSHWRI